MASAHDVGHRYAGLNFSYAGGTDCGYNVQTKVGNTVYSEMAHLYYETLGNKAYCAPGDAVCNSPQPGWGLKNTGPFTNMPSTSYWSGLQYATVPNGAWGFSTSGGEQRSFLKFAGLYVVAVRPGDVTAVPEPASFALLLPGIAGVVVVATRRRAHGALAL